MEQTQNNWVRYTSAVLHCVRYMNKYIKEVTSESGVSPKRKAELKNRFAAAKNLSKQTYFDVFKLNCLLDGEQRGDEAAKVAWNSAIRGYNDSKYGDYSVDALHTFRHLNDYIEEVERGNVSDERKTELNERFSTLMEQAVYLYFDAGRLLLILDA